MNASRKPLASDKNMRAAFGIMLALGVTLSLAGLGLCLLLYVQL